MSDKETSLLNQEINDSQQSVEDKSNLFRVTGDFDLKIEDIEALEGLTNLFQRKIAISKLIWFGEQL